MIKLMKKRPMYLNFFFLLTILFSATTGAEEYQLDIRRETVNITGKDLQRITVNGSFPAPTLYWTEGEAVVVHVTNHLDEASSVHWHGILLPGPMDGVKGLNNYPGIAPGETFTYRFTLRQTGTYWYHSHTNGQEQDGLYGALIIRPKGKDAVAYDREEVVMISDFSDETASDILSNLKISSDYYNKSRRTISDFIGDVKAKGFRRAWNDASMWSDMRMSKTDLADVSGYTFLVNGKSPQKNWTGLFKPGEKIRLHLINASAMSFYDVRILDSENKRLKMTVIQADGRAVEPVTVDEFRFGVAETYDVIIQPNEDKAYTFVAEPIDRTGFALATFAPREGMTGIMPLQRPRTLLTMADMGHDMNDAEHDMSTMDHSTMSDEEMQDMMNDMKSGWAKTGAPRGDKVLNYADLRFAGIQADAREPQREIIVTLGGNMQRYIWTMNGKTEAEAEPVSLRLGERVKLTFVNETMMAHPMHLHGMFVQLDNEQPAEKLPDKTVVIVPPGKSYSVLLTADEPGEWAFHCHLLYHMASGMMSQVVVATLDGGKPHVH
jgi:FtsP/CotA-like multicopper oxidase with cupredoxin domain